MSYEIEMEYNGELINITEELDDDDNVVNYQLEKIAQEKKFNSKILTGKKEDIHTETEEDKKKMLSYSRGFFSSSDKKEKTRVTEEGKEKKGKGKLNENYLEDTKNQFNELMEEMGISKVENHEKPFKYEEVKKTKPIKENTSLSESSIINSSTLQKTTARINKLKAKNAKSLFIPKKTSSKKSKKEIIKLPEKTKDLNIQPIKKLSKESKIEILPIESLANTIKPERKSKSKEPHESLGQGFPIAGTIIDIPKPKKEVSTEDLPQIATEDLLELQMILDEIEHSDNDSEVRDDIGGVEGEEEEEEEEEDLINMESFDEEQLYNRVFPWLKVNGDASDEAKEEPKDEEINIGVLNLDSDSDDDDDDESVGRLVLEKPIISEEILNQVKTKLAYSIDNTVLEEIKTDTILKTDSIAVSSETLKPILKDSNNSNMINEVQETILKPKKKSVKFSQTVQVKEVKPTTEIIREKIELDKLYKGVFGDEFSDIQKQISENMAIFGKSTALSVEVPEEHKEELTDDEDEVKFNEIVSDAIVEKQIIDNTFTENVNDINTNSILEKNINLTKENTRRNRKNKVSRFKQFQMSNDV